MAITSTYKAKVDLANGLDWDLFENLDSFAREQLGGPSYYSVEVNHASGIFEADSLAEARAEVEAHRHDLRRISVSIHFPSGVRCVYWSSNWPSDGWNNTVNFYGPSEAQVDGLAAVLRRRLASGAIARPSQEDVATPSQNSLVVEDSATPSPANLPRLDLLGPDPNVPDEARTPWWQNHWLLTIAAAVIATVIGGIIVAWLT